MNKILIALVLAAVISGNAYPNFITDLFKEKISCLDVVEKGKEVSDVLDILHKEYNYKVYVYKSYSVRFYYNSYDLECRITERPR